MTKVSKPAAIILAAGNSSRLGSPKQLLVMNGKTLLQHAIDCASSANVSPIILVLGANSDAIHPQVTHEKVTMIVNEEWESGMASSIRIGIETLTEISGATDCVILMVCDQPFVSSQLLTELIDERAKSGKSIVASAYDDTRGTPVLFHSDHFDELAALKGDTGAKVLLRKYASDLSIISFAKGSIDIDTREDFRNLSK